LIRGIRFKFLRDLFAILIAGTCVLSLILAVTEGNMLRQSLNAKGLSFASYIAKLSLDPLIMKDNLQLDAIVNEANKDAEILYAVIRDEQGNLVTSQYSSINYKSPRVRALLSDISKDSSFENIISSIKKRESTTEVSAPIITGSDKIGEVIICLSEHNINRQTMQTILFVIGLNLAVMVVCGLVLFINSRKSILDPIVELGQAAANLARGDLSTKVKINATGEIGMLVESFSRMAEDLEKTTVSKKTLETILDSMPFGVIIISRDKRIIGVNNAAMTLLGYDSKDELAGQICNKTLCPAEEYNCPIIDLNQKVERCEKTLVGKDGRLIPVLKTVVPISIGGEDVFLEAVVDLTDLKKAEEELKMLQAGMIHQDKMASIGQLAAGVAHEINNPAGFIMSNLGSLRRYTDKLRDFMRIQSAALEELPPEKTATVKDQAKALQIDFVCADVDNLIRESMDGMERIRKIVQDLKSFSRVDESENKLADINEGLESALNIVWNELKYKSTVKREYGVIPKTLCNLGKLNQVFMNLLLNASHAIEMTGEIVVRTWSQDKNIYVSISDTGCGIPEDIRNKIFDPFYTTKEVGKGTGLGLSIAYDIVRKHNGEIRVESSVGKGSTFTIRIPVAQE
jgi:PAS domain S-box-containing protein